MITAYCTAVESQAYLASYSDWLALTVAKQDEYLSWGRVYIDSEYLCAYDETDATDAIKHANALLGYLHFTGKLYADVPTIETSSVAAGSVSSTKTYQGGHKDVDQMFAQSDLLLKSSCTSTTSNNSVALTRN